MGMILFSRLPFGINPASIYEKGEVNFAYRIHSSAQGELECDIYDLNGHPIGLIDFMTDSGSGSFKYLPYGNDPVEIKRNNTILSQLKLSSETIYNYATSYPKKRIMLTISDDNTPPPPALVVSSEETTPPILVAATFQAKVANNTENYYFKVVNVNDTHGKWTSQPALNTKVYPPNGSFQLGMTSKGNGIQGEVNCEVYYKKNEQDIDGIKVAYLIVEINNDGTAFALFPFVNDQETSNRLKDMKFKNTLHVVNDGAYSLIVKS